MTGSGSLWHDTGFLVPFWCEWQLNADKATDRVLLTLTSPSDPSLADCSRATVRIWDGATTHVHCLGSLPQQIVSTGSIMRVYVTSDQEGGVAVPGFLSSARFSSFAPCKTSLSVPLGTWVTLASPPSDVSVASLACDVVLSSGSSSGHIGVEISALDVGCPTMLLVRGGLSSTADVLWSFCGAKVLPVIAVSSTSSATSLLLQSTASQWRDNDGNAAEYSVTLRLVNADMVKSKLQPQLACATSRADVSSLVLSDALSTASVDIDSDGDMDLVATYGTTEFRGVVWHENVGNAFDNVNDVSGTADNVHVIFEAVLGATGDNVELPLAVAAGDIDGDGKPAR